MANPKSAKVNVAHLTKVLKQHGVKKVPADVKELVALAKETLAKVAGEDAEEMVCDVCGGSSPDIEGMDACPFCGTVGEEEEEGEEGEETEEAEDGEEPTPEPKEAPKAKEEGGKGKKKGESKATPTPEAKPSALAKTKPEIDGIIEPKTGTLTEKDLDTAIAEINLLRAEGAVARFRLGLKLLETFDKGYYKLRLNENGKQAYPGFKNFVEAEIGMNKSTAYGLMDIAKAYTEDQVRKFGTKKLELMLRAPDSVKPEILADIEKGASKAQVEEKVQNAKRAERESIGAKKGSTATTRETGRKRMPAGRVPTAPVSDKITVAMTTGSRTVDFVTKATAKDETPKLAKTIGDEPVAVLELTNRVRMLFTLKKNASGGFSLTVKTKRDQA